MKVELTKLELTNYRNIEYASYDFKGNSKIVGDNRIGKTNTLEAIVWLLTDKLLNGSSDVQSIKPTNDTRKEVRVEGTFSLWDENIPQIPPRKIVLRKEFGEDWVKTRGTDFESLKGHYLTYYYNGVKQKTKKDWYALFYEDFGIKGDYKGIDLVQLLINPFYVGELGESNAWTDLRAFIISIIGDVNDDDVYKNQPSTMLIKEELRTCGGRLEQLKKQYSNEIKSIEEELIGDDANIKMLEETPCPTEEEVAIARKGKEDIEEQIAKLQGEKAGETTVIELEKELIAKRNELLEIQSRSALENKTSDLAESLATLNEEYRALLVEKAQLMESKTSAKFKIEDAKKNAVKYSEIRTNLIAKLRELDTKLASPFEGVCPTCGRPLEGEQLKDAESKYYESIKAEKEQLLAQGKENRKLLDSAIAIAQGKELEELNNQLAALEYQLKEKKDTIGKVNDRLNEENAKPIEIKENSQVYAYKEVIKDLEQRIQVAKSDINAANALIRDKIEKLTEKEQPFIKVLDSYAYAKIQKDRIEGLMNKRQDHRVKLATLEQKSELISMFMKEKLQLLDERVKTVFGNIRFQLINANLKEGSYNSVCKPYIYDVAKGESTNVTWRNGSKSERVITGIAIVEAIKWKLGLPDLPFLFDEGGEISEETFNTRFNTNSQLICVKVQDNIMKPTVMNI